MASLKALFSVFSQTASLQFADLGDEVTILKSLCPTSQLSDQSWQMGNLFVSVRWWACKSIQCAYNYICASTCLDESLQTWWKVDFLPLCKHASALLCKVCITLQSVQLRGAKIPKFGGREHNFVHNRAGVLLPPPRSVIKEFHQGNIFFSEGEKISGKYCPQSPIIGPFANLFRRGAVFAQREYWRNGGKRGGRAGGGEVAFGHKTLCLLNGLLSVRLTLEVF